MGILFDYATGNEEEQPRKVFKDYAMEDIHDVFLNWDEFAEKRTIQYDGNTWEDVLVVPIGPKETRRVSLTQAWKDNTQGLYKRKITLYVAIADIGGVQPERGTYLQINAREGSKFMRKYLVAESEDEKGMALLTLEETDQ